MAPRDTSCRHNPGMSPTQEPSASPRQPVSTPTSTYSTLSIWRMINMFPAGSSRYVGINNGLLNSPGSEDRHQTDAEAQHAQAMIEIKREVPSSPLGPMPPDVPLDQDHNMATESPSAFDWRITPQTPRNNERDDFRSETPHIKNEPPGFQEWLNATSANTGNQAHRGQAPEAKTGGMVDCVRASIEGRSHTCAICASTDSENSPYRHAHQEVLRRIHDALSRFSGGRMSVQRGRLENTESGSLGT